MTKEEIEMLEEFKTVLDSDQAQKLNDILFVCEFKEATAKALEYDKTELKRACGRDNKVMFISELYKRDELVEFLNKYWDKMDLIIVMIKELLTDEE